MGESILDSVWQEWSLSEKYVRLAETAAPRQGAELSTRPLGGKYQRLGILLGLDVYEYKHLLIPIDSERTVDESGTKGVMLRSIPLRQGRVDQQYLDIVCVLQHLDPIFERLLEDLLERLEVEGVDPVVAAHNTLDDWRALLQSVRRPLSIEAIAGLTGELEILRRLSEKNPIQALDSWLGPSGEIHDFVHEGKKIEVKATTKVDGSSIQISNLLQLDPANSATLHLAALHLVNDFESPSLNERVDDLIAMGVPRNKLWAILNDVGFSPADRYEGKDRYKVLSAKFWEVGEDFPGLRRSGFDETQLRGVESVNYDLNLSALPEPLSDEQEIEMLETFLKRTAG